MGTMHERSQKEMGNVSRCGMRKSKCCQQEDKGGPAGEGEERLGEKLFLLYRKIFLFIPQKMRIFANCIGMYLA